METLDDDMNQIAGSLADVSAKCDSLLVSIRRQPIPLPMTPESQSLVAASTKLSILRDAIRIITGE